MSNKYKVAVIGLGQKGYLYENDPKMIASFKYCTHCQTIDAHPRFSLTAGCDIDPQKVEQAHGDYHFTYSGCDYRKLFNDVDIDLAVVATLTGTHPDIIRHTLNAGIRHILCEKPVSSDLILARDVFALVDRCRGDLFVNYWRFFDRSHQLVKRVIVEKTLGDVLKVCCYYGKGVKNTASHLIHLFLDYFGEIEWIKKLTGDSSHASGDDLDIDFVFGTRSGIVGSVLYIPNDDYRIFEIDILCSKGRIRVADGGRVIELFGRESNSTLTNEYQLSNTGTLLPETAGEAMFDLYSFIAEVLDSGKRFVDYRALKTAELLDQLIRESGSTSKLDA
jgi:predicted dehydrogenase